MYTSASNTKNDRVPMHTLACVDLDDEAMPRRVHRIDAPSKNDVASLFTPIISRASASGAPALQIPIRRRNSRRREPGMTANIEPSLSIDVHH